MRKERPICDRELFAAPMLVPVVVGKGPRIALSARFLFHLKPGLRKTR